MPIIELVVPEIGLGVPEIGLEGYGDDIPADGTRRGTRLRSRRKRDVNSTDAIHALDGFFHGGDPHWRMGCWRKWQ